MTEAVVLLAFVYVGVLLLRGGLALSYARTLPPARGGGEAPAPGALTVVQPILSGDPLLAATLAANLSELPGQAFLWLVDEDDAEARRIAAAPGRDAPGAAPGAMPVVILCPPCPEGVNPKVWKLRRAAAEVRTPYLCVLDDDTILPAATAAALVRAAGARTVATGLPCYLDAGDVASGLLAQFVNNNAVFTYLGTSRLVPPLTLNGMGYVMRRETLDLVERFAPIERALTDDLALAALVLARGGAIHQSRAPLVVRTGVKGPGHYIRLMHRWYVFSLLLVKRQRVGVRLLVLGLHGAPPLVFAVLFAAAVAAVSPVAVGVVAGVLVARMLVLRAVLRRFFSRTLPRSLPCPLHRPVLSVVSELLQPFHLAHALVVRTIRWRVRRYRVRGTGEFEAA